MWLTNLCDEDSELVKVTEALSACSQLPDHLVELLCPRNRVLHKKTHTIYMHALPQTIKLSRHLIGYVISNTNLLSAQLQTCFLCRTLLPVWIETVMQTLKDTK